MVLERDVPVPLLLAAAVDRQSGIDIGRPDRDQAAGEHADVLVVHVERVERLRREVGGLEELVDVVHLTVSELAVEEQVERVLAVARPLAGDRHQAAVHAGVPEHRSMDGLVVRDLLTGEGAGVEELHRATAPVVEVLDPASTAQRLDVGVDLIEPGRGQRPAGVLAAPDEDVTRERERCDAALRDARPMEIHLEGEPGVVVADLGPGDHDRMTVGRTPARDEQRIAGVNAAVVGARQRLSRRRGQAARVEQDVAGRALRRRLQLDASRDARRGRRVVALTQVGEDLPAPLGAEAPLQRRQELGAHGFIAAALTHELVLERVDGVDVRAGERRHG